jgi:tripartite-type tricarboxylate transporter receptor subunit TctC
MNLPKSLAVLVAACVWISNASAAEANSSPVRLIVGFAPGGALDTVARAVAERMRTTLNQPVLVDNRPGAGQRIALNELKRAKADGLTLILANSTPFTIYPHIYQKLEFDPARDFTPLGRVATFELGVSAGPAAPVGGIKEFLAWAKSNPDKGMFGTPGAGTPGHLLGEFIGKAAGVPLVHVPYKGGAPAMTDLTGGQIPIVVDTILEALEMSKGGKVRILATSGSTRTAVTPNVPTLRESGVDVVFDAYIGLYAPAGMPADKAQRISQALEETLRSEDLQRRLTQFAYKPAYASPAAVVQLQASELKRWEAPVKAIGFVAD